MIKAILETEVHISLKSPNGDGAPGPDGFPLFFFVGFWSFLKADIMVAVEEFQQGNYGFDYINRSHLILFPRHQWRAALRNIDLLLCVTLFTW